MSEFVALWYSLYLLKMYLWEFRPKNISSPLTCSWTLKDKETIRMWNKKKSKSEKVCGCAAQLLKLSCLDVHKILKNVTNCLWKVNEVKQSHSVFCSGLCVVQFCLTFLILTPPLSPSHIWAMLLVHSLLDHSSKPTLELSFYCQPLSFVFKSTYFLLKIMKPLFYVHLSMTYNLSSFISSSLISLLPVCVLKLWLFFFLNSNIFHFCRCCCLQSIGKVLELDSHNSSINLSIFCHHSPCTQAAGAFPSNLRAEAGYRSLCLKKNDTDFLNFVAVNIFSSQIVWSCLFSAATCHPAWAVHTGEPFTGRLVWSLSAAELQHTLFLSPVQTAGLNQVCGSVTSVQETHTQGLLHTGRVFKTNTL